MNNDPGAKTRNDLDIANFDIAATIAGYRQASVRDLAWLMLSPALFSRELGRFPAFEPRLKHLQTLDWLAAIDSKTLEQSFPQRQHFRRLGLYCEALFEYFFSNSEEHATSDYSFIARNVQYHHKGTTLGELDFLLRNRRTGEVCHVELAVKFFLQAQTNTQHWSHWIGPNGKDRLDLKLNRMIAHQMELPHQAQCQELTAGLAKKYALNHPIHSFHFIKGALFAHPKSLPGTALPMSCTQANAAGTWERLCELRNSDRGDYYFCDKMAWLTPTIPSPAPTDTDSSRNTNGDKRQSALNAMAVTEKIESLHSLSREKFKGGVPGAMIISIDASGHAQPSIIVPDYWPATDSPLRKI